MEQNVVIISFLPLSFYDTVQLCLSSKALCVLLTSETFWK